MRRLGQLWVVKVLEYAHLHCWQIDMLGGGDQVGEGLALGWDERQWLLNAEIEAEGRCEQFVSKGQLKKVRLGGGWYDEQL